MRVFVVLWLFAVCGMVRAQSPDIQSDVMRSLTTKDVQLQLRLADEKELPSRRGRGCEDVGPGRLECRPLALEVVNLSHRTIHLFHWSCSDRQITVEIRRPMQLWRSPDPMEAGIGCSMNAPVIETIAPGGRLLRPFRISSLGFGALPITGDRIMMRATWNFIGCVDDDPGDGCGRGLVPFRQVGPFDSRVVSVESNELRLFPGTSRNDALKGKAVAYGGNLP